MSDLIDWIDGAIIGEHINWMLSYSSFDQMLKAKNGFAVVVFHHPPPPLRPLNWPLPIGEWKERDRVVDFFCATPDMQS